MPASEPLRLFTSYAHRDGADLARRLHKELVGKGFDAWLDTESLIAGEVWSKEIEQAIDRAVVVVAVLSDGSFTSDICHAEQGLGGKCVVPVRAQCECRIPVHLKTRQHLDFSNPALHEEQLSNLIESIEKKHGGVIPTELPRAGQGSSRWKAAVSLRGSGRISSVAPDC